MGNGEAGYWRMQNGYLLPDRPSGLAKLAGRLRGEKGLAESVRDSLRVGVHLGGKVCHLLAKSGWGVRPP